MARPRIIADSEDLQRHVNAYFDSVDKNNSNTDSPVKDYYTWPDLLLFLGVTQPTVDRWLTETETYPGYKDVMQVAMLRLQSQIEKMGFGDSKKTGIVAFMLKQKHYGGYTDKPVSAADSINVKVTLEGTGHKDAFG